MPDNHVDILLCQRFVPEIGGSIQWLYEVYRRWPGPVQVVTQDYYGAPIRTPECPGEFVRPRSGDHVSDANLTMDRRDIFLHNWGFESPARVRRYLRMTGAVRERLNDPAHRGAIIRVHCGHAVPEGASLIPLRWRYGRRLRIIAYAHGEELTACASSRQLRWLLRRSLRHVDLLIANGRFTADKLAGQIDAAKVRIVHPGVSVGAFASAGEAGARWRAREHLGPDTQMVLTVGRVDPRKNHGAVIEALAALRDRLPPTVYVIAGVGRNSAALQELTGRLGMTDRVRFVGAVDPETKLALYGACDVFAMPGVYDGTDVEGFGIVFIEAGACGKACLAGAVGGQPEAVLDDQTGLVVDGADQASVNDALLRLLTDRALRERLGQAGRQRAAELDWERTVQRTVELVEEVS